MKFWKLFDWKNYNTPAQNLRVILVFLAFIIITYILSSNQNVNYPIFFIFIILITKALISFSAMCLLRPISKLIMFKILDNPELIKKKGSTEFPEYLGSLRYHLLEKIIFNMNGYVLTLSFIIIFPIAKIINHDLTLTIIIIIILFLDFIIKQNTLSWRLENPEKNYGIEIFFEWKHSNFGLFQFHFIQLLIIPGIILFLYLSNFNLYYLSESSLKLPVGIYWYLFNGVGTIMLFFNVFLLLWSFINPKIVWQTYTDMSLE